MKPQLNSLLVLILAFTLNTGVKADDKHGIEVSAQPVTEQDGKPDEKAQYHSYIVRMPALERLILPQLIKTKNVDPQIAELNDSLFLPQPTLKEQKCLTDLGFTPKDIYQLKMDYLETSNLFKCSVEINNSMISRVAPLQQARGQLKMFACKELESAKKVSKLKIECDEYKPTAGVKLLGD